MNCPQMNLAKKEKTSMLSCFSFTKSSLLDLPCDACWTAGMRPVGHTPSSWQAPHPPYFALLRVCELSIWDTYSPWNTISAAWWIFCWNFFMRPWLDVHSWSHPWGGWHELALLSGGDVGVNLPCSSAAESPTYLSTEHLSSAQMWDHRFWQSPAGTVYLTSSPAPHG